MSSIKYLIVKKTGSGMEVITHSSALGRAKEYAEMAASESSDSESHIYSFVSTIIKPAVIERKTPPSNGIAKRKAAPKAAAPAAPKQRRLWTEEEDSILTAFAKGMIEEDIMVPDYKIAKSLAANGYLDRTAGSIAVRISRLRSKGLIE